MGVMGSEPGVSWYLIGGLQGVSFFADWLQPELIIYIKLILSTSHSHGNDNDKDRHHHNHDNDSMMMPGPNFWQG